MTERVLILDADIPLFRSSAKAQSSMVVDGVVFSIAQTAEQEFMFDSYVNQIREATKIDEVIMAVTARDGNFRKLVLPSYKATRAYTPKPVGYPQLLE